MTRPAPLNLISLLFEQHIAEPRVTHTDLTQRIRERIVHGPYVCHPYGFIALKLHNVSESYAAKLHVWLPGERPALVPNWPIHSHGKLLHSVILLGTLTNDIWEFVTTSEGGSRIYTAHNTDDGTTLVATDILGEPRLVSQAAYAQGEMYTVAAPEFHIAHVNEQVCTVTCAISGPRSEAPVHVVGQNGGAARYTNHYTALQEALIRQVQETLESLFGKVP